MQQEVDSRFSCQSRTVWAPLVGNVILPLPDSLCNFPEVSSDVCLLLDSACLLWCKLFSGLHFTAEALTFQYGSADWADTSFPVWSLHPRAIIPAMHFLWVHCFRCCFPMQCDSFCFLIEAFTPWMLNMKTASVGLLSTSLPLAFYVVLVCAQSFLRSGGCSFILPIEMLFCLLLHCMW